MAKHIGLVLSSVVAGTLTLAATASAQNPPPAANLGDDTNHAFWMYEQAVALYGVDNGSYYSDPNSPEMNRWAGTLGNGNPEPCSITWVDPYNYSTIPSAVTKGSCFLTLAIRKADPTITSSVMSLGFGWATASPSARSYYDFIVAGKKFWNIAAVANIGVGDVLATKFGSDGGYTMVVVGAEAASPYDVNDTPNDLSDDLARIKVQVVDSTTTPHWNQDTRWGLDPRHPTQVGNQTYNQDQGIGYGYIFITVDSSGGIAGHAWSDQGQNQSDYYANNANGRPIVAGRFDRNK